MKSKKTVFYSHIKLLLQEQLKKRQDETPAFSLRAFAKELKISPGLLSDYLNGVKHPTVKRIHDIGKSLDLSEEFMRPYVTPLTEFEKEDHQGDKTN